jgi:hypothetical protein
MFKPAIIALYAASVPLPRKTRPWFPFCIGAALSVSRLCIVASQSNWPDFDGRGHRVVRQKIAPIGVVPVRILSASVSFILVGRHLGKDLLSVEFHQASNLTCVLSVGMWTHLHLSPYVQRPWGKNLHTLAGYCFDF